MTNDPQGSPKRPQPKITAGQFGHGVYLSDMVRWLMEKHDALRVHVVNEYLCPALLTKGPGLYRLSSDEGGVTALADFEWFDTPGGGPAQGWRYLSAGIDAPPPPPPAKASSFGRGVEGAAKWLQAYWGTPNKVSADTWDNVRHSFAACLVVSEADARRCWGWASDATSGAGPVPDASIEVAAPWSPERLKARLDELKGQRVHAYMQQLSKESGIADRKIRHMLNALGTPQQKAGHFDGLTKKKRGGRP